MAVVPLDKDVFFLLSTEPSINVFVGCVFSSLLDVIFLEKSSVH